MRISDWSSDVCSSDLGVGEIRHIALKDGTMLTLDTDSRVDVALSSNERKLSLVRGKAFLDVTRWQKNPVIIQAGSLLLQMVKVAFGLQNLVDMRSEERRVGHECGRTCRSRCSRSH